MTEELKQYLQLVANDVGGSYSYNWKHTTSLSTILVVV